MGSKNKLKRFRENETFDNVIQPDRATLNDQKFSLKGKWNTHFFKNNNPIVLELGCGKGEYSVHLATQHPDKNYIGIDIKGARFWRGAKTALENEFTNVAFLRAQIELITSCFSQNEVDEIWITFPDPQIKYKREDSSLVFMVDHLIKKTKRTDSGFYLNDWEALRTKLNALESKGQKTILLGVSFALLDGAENFQWDLKNTLLMETGGMKGMRKEWVRSALHQKLRDSYQVNQIHSEYGMTELLSQAYSKADGVFETPPWMRVFARSVEDPFELLHNNKTGALNIIDLANVDSCAFIATQDLGKLHSDKRFEVLGRFDHAEIRGCNLMVL